MVPHIGRLLFQVPMDISIDDTNIQGCDFCLLSYAFQIMVFQRRSFVAMENSSQAENTRSLQQSMDSSSLPAVHTTPRAMVS